MRENAGTRVKEFFGGHTPAQKKVMYHQILFEGNIAIIQIIVYLVSIQFRF